MLCVSDVFICYYLLFVVLFFFFKQKTAYEMRISDWSSDVCSSDLLSRARRRERAAQADQAVGKFRQESWCAAGGRDVHERRACALPQIGRASCRERVCQYV